MDSELRRAIAFEEGLRERCAERIVPFRFGRAVFNDTFRSVYDLNGLRVDEPGAATVDVLAEEAERLHGAAGHDHRRITVLDEKAGGRLVDGFRELGWNADRFLLMAYRSRGERSVETGEVEEVDAATLRPLHEEIVRAEPWADSDEIVRQILDSSELVARAASARHFAVRAGGEAVSGADLYSDGHTAQVEDVSTRRAVRGRGLASAVTLRAVQEALAAGHDFVFLVAADDDWPKELYARLGFAPLGRKWTFLKRPAPAGRA
ncbi:MAG: GNAT family N-acetyltransferase [Candidatus Limnocylindria bacterium]